MKRLHPLLVELLEDRLAPANFGFTWPDATHLTISLVPDNTSAGSAASGLYRLLDSEIGPGLWQREILRAVQTWAASANIGISVVTDGGQPLGTAGAIQGDSRFGDIRVAALPLGPDALSSGTPFSPYGGSWSGDILLNSDAHFGIGSTGAPDLYSVMLHEMGHVFGLDDSTDPNSVMFGNYAGARGGLSTSDVQAIQSLYGTRASDALEGTRGNDTRTRATDLETAALAQYLQLMADPVTAASASLVPFSVSADITTRQDVDFYSYRTDRFTPNFTVQLQSSGRSLLEAKLTVLDGNGNVVSASSAVDPLSGDLTIRIDNARSNSTYYVKVESNSADAFGVGGYQLKLRPDAPQPLLNLLDGLAHRLQRDRSDNTLRTAVDLGRDIATTNDQTDFTTSGLISSQGDIDFYRFRAPDSGTTAQSMTVMVWAGGGLQPAIAVYDANGQPLAAEVLVNGDGSVIVRIDNAVSNATYFVSVQAANAGGFTSPTAYSLAIDFSTRSTSLESFADGTLTAPPTEEAPAALAFGAFAFAAFAPDEVVPPDSPPPSVDPPSVVVPPSVDPPPVVEPAVVVPPVVVPPPVQFPAQHDFRSVQVREGTVFHLEFSANAPGATVETSVQVTLFNAAGVVVFEKTFVTGTKLKVDVFLKPGDYTFRFVAGSKDGSPLPAMAYHINGAGLNEPIGPPLVDPNQPPPARPLPFVWLNYGLFRVFSLIDPYGHTLPLTGG
ncbi:MAG: matrixin family metalloprotease [Gemmataceae bacterium]|nr:matrixin family metalloprotease [Gemmataceae bacterium]